MEQMVRIEKSDQDIYIKERSHELYAFFIHDRLDVLKRYYFTP